MLAEGHLTRGRFAVMLQRIAMLPLPAANDWWQDLKSNR
jgi:hypothetical protein